LANGQDLFSVCKSHIPSGIMYAENDCSISSGQQRLRSVLAVRVTQTNASE